MAIQKTPSAGLSYPDDNEALKDVPDFIRLLAIDLDLMVIGRYESVLDRNDKITAPVEGTMAWMKDTNTLVVFDGVQWRQVYPAVPKLSSGNVAPTGAGAAGDIYVQF